MELSASHRAPARQWRRRLAGRAHPRRRKPLEPCYAERPRLLRASTIATGAPMHLRTGSILVAALGHTAGLAAAAIAAVATNTFGYLMPARGVSTLVLLR